MLRKILSTTALVAVVSTGAAFAQDTNTTEPMKQPEASSAMENGASPIFPDRQAAGEDAKSFYGATGEQVLASSLLGWPVYGMSAETQEREQVGDIADIVMNTDGTANAAVIGVGGFLGIGEKEVAISFDRLSWEPGENGAWLSIDATREELEAAPEFESDNENLMKVGRAPAPEGTMAEGSNDLANSAGTALDEAGNATGEAMNDVATGIGTAADATGNAISWSSSGQQGFKGSRKGTPFAAQLAAEAAARTAKEHGLRVVDVELKGAGSGRESALRAIQAQGIEVLSIKDVTPMPHNGCRLPKRRRV